MPLPLPPGAPTYTSRLLGWEVASCFARSFRRRCSGLPHPTKPATWLDRLESTLIQTALHVFEPLPSSPQRCHHLVYSQEPRHRSRTSRWSELVVQPDKAFQRDYLGFGWTCLQADRRRPATAKPWNLALLFAFRVWLGRCTPASRKQAQTRLRSTSAAWSFNLVCLANLVPRSSPRDLHYVV